MARKIINLGSFGFIAFKYRPEHMPECRELLARDPSDVDALCQLAGALAAVEGPDSAVAELREYVDRSPNDPSLQMMLAAHLMDAGRLAEVEAPVRAALDLGWNEPNLFLWLGDSLEAQDDTDGARHYWKQARSLALEGYSWPIRLLVNAVGTGREVRRRLKRAA